MKKIAVIGAGAMGSGIAQVAAMHGCEVILYDAYPASIVKARDSISASLQKFAEKGKISDAASKAIFGRLYFVESLDTIADAELVIEAVIENEQIKHDLFKKISSIVTSQTIIASNTSSLSITGLAASVSYPERFIGIHFFNPAVLMQLVEVIPALQTSKDTENRVVDLIASWNKTPVIARDTPGFIVNRIARPYYSEALRIAEEQIATPAEIDAAMKTFGGFRMGPFELMDFIGHDVNYAVTNSVWKAMFFESRYRPSHLQGNLVKAGWLGRKSKKGFYSYDENTPQTSLPAKEEHRFIFDRILTMLIHEAADALMYGVANSQDIDQAMTLGVNYPKGLLAWADELGAQYLVVQIDHLYAQYHEERYRGSALLRKMARDQQKFFK